MIALGLARRYVQPLYEIAQEKVIVQRISGDLKVLDKTLRDNDEFRTFLMNPSVDRSAKKGVMEALFAEFSKFSLNFIRLVIQKNRTEVLIVARSLFNGLIEDASGVITGMIESAVPIDENTLKQVRAMLSRRFEGELHLATRADPELIGGLRVRVGNTVIDGSVNHRLEQLEESMAGS